MRERLVKFARERYGLGMTRFERYVGLPSGTIHKVSDGMSSRQVEKILKACPELNAEWLITGEGMMLKSAPSGAIPLLSFSAVAGYLSDNNLDEKDLAFCMVPDFNLRGADCAIRIDGDSMSPRYRNGEILAIRIVKDPTFFQWGRVYVLSTNQGCVIKKLLPCPDDDEKVICRSENTTDFPDYTIRKTDILNVAIVVGHIGLD